jgi:hypothetical protein
VVCHESRDIRLVIYYENVGAHANSVRFGKSAIPELTNAGPARIGRGLVRPLSSNESISVFPYPHRNDFAKATLLTGGGLMITQEDPITLPARPYFVTESLQFVATLPSLGILVVPEDEEGSC